MSEAATETAAEAGEQSLADLLPTGDLVDDATEDTVTEPATDQAASDDEADQHVTDEAGDAEQADDAAGGEVASDEVVSEDELLDESAAAAQDVPDEDDPWTRPGSWYVVHTQSGYEKKVTANLHARIQSMNMEDQIFEVVIPMEDVVEIKGGKKQTVQRKVFPGYILVRCEMTDESWYCIRNTPGVTGFVGQSDRGQKPTPLSGARCGRSCRPSTVQPPTRPGAPSPSSTTKRARACASRRARSRTSWARSPRSTPTT